MIDTQEAIRKLTSIEKKLHAAIDERDNAEYELYKATEVNPDDEAAKKWKKESETLNESVDAIWAEWANANRELKVLCALQKESVLRCRTDTKNPKC